MKTALLRWVESRGYDVAWGPVTVLGDVQRELASRVAAGDLDSTLPRDTLSFDFDAAGHGGDARRVLVLVVPRPAHVVRFEVGACQVDTLVPPTYQRYRPTFEEIRLQLAERVWPGCRVETLSVPLKLLAARLGLVRYGRNNLAYAPRFGSYFQLVGYVTDAPLSIATGWAPAEPSLLAACERCRACAAHCPTGAIDPARVLIRAERCLTLATETPGPWPPWVPDRVQECLIGCLRCQRVCPANGALPTAESGIAFTAEESAALLCCDEHRGALAAVIERKLGALVGPNECRVIGRNLAALLRARDVPVPRGTP
jgi:epoxyqueuosine reductase